MYQPLADLIRPQTLDDVCGQTHILGPNGLLRRIIESGQIPNMIFYGPSGTGKTTIANIIAKQTQRKLCKLNATTAVYRRHQGNLSPSSDTFLAPNGVLLYLDEIQYFSKKQQQSAAGIHRKRQDHAHRLHNGKSRISTSTTRSSAAARSSSSSRSTADDSAQGRRACRCISAKKRTASLPSARTARSSASHRPVGGDVRKAARRGRAARLRRDGSRTARHLTLADATAGWRSVSNMRYDRDGDSHYDILSALQKSVRGSDPDAALHYLARLLEAGDMISAARRMLVIASEDIGLAYPQCARHRQGVRGQRVPARPARGAPAAGQRGHPAWPPRRSPIRPAWPSTPRSPMSRPAEPAMSRASCKNVHADGAGFERDQGYLYPHNFPGHWVKQQYLPDEIKDRKYYTYGDNKTEQAAKRYWDEIKK